MCVVGCLLSTPRTAFDLFSTDELTAWPLPFEAEWRAHAMFAGADGLARWDILHKRVVQHVRGRCLCVACVNLFFSSYFLLLFVEKHTRINKCVYVCQSASPCAFMCVVQINCW